MSANRNVRISAPETNGGGAPDLVSSATIRRVYDPASAHAVPAARAVRAIVPGSEHEKQRTRLQRERGPTHPTPPSTDGRVDREGECRRGGKGVKTTLRRPERELDVTVPSRRSHGGPDGVRRVSS